MNKYKSAYHGYKPVLEKSIFDCNSQQVTLYPDSPIICKKNCEELELINNDQLIIIK